MNVQNSCMRPLLAIGLSLALLPCITKAQTPVSDGTVDVAFAGIDETYEVTVFEDGGTANPPNGAQTPLGYGAPAQLALSNLDSPVVTLPSTSLTLFCSELGQDSSATGNTYQILDPNSLQYTDATNLAVSASDPTGTPSPMASVAMLETDGNITPAGGIGPTKASELSALYGYAFGANGQLNSGYNLTGVSIPNQVAFQVAVWKLAYDGSGYIPAGSALNPLAVDTVTSSGLSITGIDSTVANEANLLLAAVYTNNNGLGITPMELEELNNGTTQDFLLPTDSSFAAIPEPSTYAAILGAAALGFIMVRRKLRPA
jgi:hypothetical protein